MNGGLCIFAAGNNGEEGNYYPGCLDKVVAVGSMAPDGSVAYYSNRGKWVDVTAPGGLEDNGQQYGVLSTFLTVPTVTTREPLWHVLMYLVLQP